MYHSLIVERSIQLRNEQTLEERKLWYVYLKKYPIKIRRQYPLDYYIADFFCREAGLIIEIDGIQHQLEVNIKYDEKISTSINESNPNPFSIQCSQPKYYYYLKFVKN